MLFVYMRKVEINYVRFHKSWKQCSLWQKQINFNIIFFQKFDFNNGIHNINFYLYFDLMKQKNIEDVNKKELILIDSLINKYFYALNWRNVIFFNIIQLKYNRPWDEKFL